MAKKLTFILDQVKLSASFIRAVSCDKQDSFDYKNNQDSYLDYPTYNRVMAKQVAAL